MDDPEALLPVGLAGQVAGIPERTLRNWIRAGKLPASEGPRGKLVRVGDVRGLAELTGRSAAIGRPSAGNDRPAMDPATLAGNPSGQPADLVPDPDRLAEVVGRMLAPALAAAAEREAELARALGRAEAERDAAGHGRQLAEAERDALRAEVERLRAEQDASVGPREGLGRAETVPPVSRPAQSLWDRLRGLFGR
jgi:hypothetical protein